MPLDLDRSTIDWFVCQCGNEPNRDGFYTCTEDGAYAEPALGGLWQGYLYVCISCFAIYNVDTMDQIGVASLKNQALWTNGEMLNV